MKIDVIYEDHNSDYTSYRVCPNPDAEPGTGYEGGAVLLFSDKGGNDNWSGHFFISKESIPGLAEAFTRIAEELE